MTKAARRESLLRMLGLIVAVLSTNQTALAADVTVSVLGLEPAAGAPEQVASTVTEAMRQRIATSAGHRLVPGRDLVEVKLVFSCPDEAPACMTQAAQSMNANKVVFGNVQPVGTESYLVTLKILDTERGLIEAWISEQIMKSQATPIGLRVPIQKWFATLTGQSQPGTLRLTGGVVGAAVWLDGVQAGLLGADGLTMGGVTAGPHLLTVSKLGYEKFERNVTIPSGAVERLAVELRAIGASAATPIAAAPVKPAGLDVTPAAEVEHEGVAPRQGSRVAAWALLGAGLVGAGLGVYASYRVSDINDKLDPYRRFPCASDPSQLCGLDGKPAKELDEKQRAYVSKEQDSGDTYSALQWVGYGVGGALMATSTIFFYRGYASSSSDTARAGSGGSFALVPTVGPRGAGATAFLRF